VILHPCRAQVLRGMVPSSNLVNRGADKERFVKVN